MDGADKRADSVFDIPEKVKCDDKTDKRADDVLQLIMPVGSDIEMPESSTELKKYCTLFNKNFPFILGVFKHCSSSFGQTIAKLLIFPVRKNMGNVCKEGKLTRQGRDFIIASECANKARDRYKGCNSQLIDALNGIALAPVKNRMYMTCWYVFPKICFQ